MDLYMLRMWKYHVPTLHHWNIPTRWEYDWWDLLGYHDDRGHDDDDGDDGYDDDHGDHDDNDDHEN